MPNFRVNKLSIMPDHIRTLSRTLRTVACLLAAIGLAMVIRRTLVIAGVLSAGGPGGVVRGSAAGGISAPGGAGGVAAGSGGRAALDAGRAAFDSGFGQHPVMTMLHILAGAFFLIPGLLQFWPAMRKNHPLFLRRSEGLFFVAGYVTGFSALCLPFIIPPVGGLNESACTTLFSVFFLVCLTRTLQCRKDAVLHREWLIRVFAIGLAVATIRPIIGLFFAFSGLPPQVFFGTAFWIGFTLHAIAAEVWIHYTRMFPADGGG